ncbi:hypothetical protein AAE478_002459 [Parahypoxylon ruwenzoriense]
MSNSTTFSYAQAAKGQSAAQSIGSQSSLTQSQAPSVASTHSRDAMVTPSTRAPSVAVSTTSNEIDGSQGTRNSSTMREPSSLNHNDTDSIPTNEKTAESSNLLNQGISDRVLSEVVPQSTERRGRIPNPNSQATDATDGKKTRKGKKGRATEKESEQEQGQDKKENVALKPELSEAPVPAVNVWTQRAAQFKATSSTTTQLRSSNNTSTSQLDGTSNLPSKDQKQKAIPNDGADTTTVHSRPLSSGLNPSKPPKKDFEQSRNSSNQTSRRTTPRGNRSPAGEDRPAFEALNSVANNTSSWPTPETAVNGLKAKPQTEKMEKDEKDEAGPSKPRPKEKWVQMHFVPTVNFETPLPARGSRGGRTGGSRGGRDAMTRGNHNNSVAGPTGNHITPPRASSSLTDRAQDRVQDSGTASATGSAPVPASKRASDVPTPRDARKPQTQQGAAKVPGENSSPTSKVDASKPNQPDLVNGNANQNHPVRAVGSSQRADEAAKASQPARENGAQGAKDASLQGQNNVGRNDRTRGGTRGRGGHSSMNGAAHQQSQYGQGPNGYGYSNNASPRQPNHTYTGYPPVSYGSTFPAQATGGHRSRPSSGNNRTQGNARHQSSRTANFPVVGISYDTGMYHGNGTYSGYNDPGHIISVVLSQVEYYFSINNLCKDWYLRRHMDSQGFVPLSVIASFKRLREIAQDYQIVRVACEHSPYVEFVVTEDGQDKVRRRDQWEPWVLEVHERHASAQNDGPANWRPFSSQMAYYQQMMPYGGETAPIFSPIGTDPNFASYMNGGSHTVFPTTNGVNGHAPHLESQLSATVPEFSPTGNPSMGLAGQQVAASLDAASNEPEPESTGGKVVAPSSLDQIDGPLPNGSHHHGDIEIVQGDKPSTNGIDSNHGTEC